MNVVILAAGMGKRMHSDLPKVLHPLAGKPMLGHVIASARALQPKRLIVIHGHGGEAVQRAFPDTDLHWAPQIPQLGTGHAVMQATAMLDDAYPTLILYGDVPLTSVSTLQRLIEAAAGGGHGEALAILTVTLPDATGYGRIVRAQGTSSDASHGTAGRILCIVEHKDASESERLINEVNTGIMVAPTARLKKWLAALSNDNAQGEYYLTDIVAMACNDDVLVTSAQPDDEWETLGVNSKSQLAALERQYQCLQAEELMTRGATLADPARIDIRGELAIGRDVSIDVNCVFEGTVSLGDRVRIAANCVLRNVQIAADTHVEAFSHLDGASIGPGSHIGPFARLRPGAVLADGTHIGNFVEVKNSSIGSGSKANHLSYIGDATVGARVNVGAGVITCNYDGANKHRTVIGDDVFIGSDTQLVAPITVGDFATIGAGTTLTKDAPANELTLSRAKQVSFAGWKRPVKVKKD